MFFDQVKTVKKGTIRTERGFMEMTQVLTIREEEVDWTGEGVDCCFLVVEYFETSPGHA